jgi:hypothetical protein
MLCISSILQTMDNIQHNICIMHQPMSYMSEESFNVTYIYIYIYDTLCPLLIDHQDLVFSSSDPEFS